MRKFTQEAARELGMAIIKVAESKPRKEEMPEGGASIDDCNTHQSALELRAMIEALGGETVTSAYYTADAHYVFVTESHKYQLASLTAGVLVGRLANMTLRMYTYLRSDDNGFYDFFTAELDSIYLGVAAGVNILNGLKGL